jgi:2-phospho-L-lactate guanylyltransferase
VKTWAVLPIKPLVRGKSRLAPVLSPMQRERLSLGMLLHNIHLLKGLSSISNIMVISRDTKVLSIARDLGVYTVQESGQPELNPALMRASKLIHTWGGDAMLILPSDVPLVAAEDIDQIVHLGRFPATLVIAPDASKDGTNALLVNPPGLISYSYGTGSFQRHVAAAELAGATVEVYESERLALDVDTPEDLEEYVRLVSKLGVPIIDFQWEAVEG